MEWRVIDNTEGEFSVSSCGVVYNNLKGVEVPQRVNGGYKVVSIRYNGKSCPEKVHRLVAKNFVKNEYGYNQVKHLDGDRLNNTHTNLAWVSRVKGSGYKLGNLVNGVRVFPEDTERLSKLCGTDHMTIVSMLNKGLSEIEMYLGGVDFSQLVDYNGRRYWSKGEGIKSVSRFRNFKREKEKVEEEYNLVNNWRIEHLNKIKRLGKDLHKMHHGVGIMDYWGFDKRCPEMEHIWEELIDRCYNKNSRSYHRYGEKGCRVCDEWKVYSNFKRWRDNNSHDWGVRADIDKDIKVAGNTLYSPEFCLIVPYDVNLVFRDYGGLTIIYKGGMYYLDTKLRRKRIVYKGSFNEVISQWREGRKETARRVLNKYTELSEVVKDRLLNYDPVEESKKTSGTFKVIVKNSCREVIEVVDL